mgnify:CR=1 FL=1
MRCDIIPRLSMPSPSEPHLWSFANSVATAPCDCLAHEERERAARYVRPERSAQSLTARAHLRHVLAAYVAKPARALAIASAPSGKPFMEQRGGETPVRFSVSHTQGFIVIAIARFDVGVDCERVRALEHAEKIAQRWFGARAAQFIVSSTNPQLAFFERWCLLEALAKRSGLGLAGVNKSGTQCEHELVEGKLKLIPMPENFVVALASQSAIQCVAVSLNYRPFQRVALG